MAKTMQRKAKAAPKKASSLARGMSVPKERPRAPVAPEVAERIAAPAAADSGPRRPTPSALRRVERGTRLTVYLPPDLEQRLRVYCAQQRRSQSDAVTAAVEALLGRE